jgi:hypothetical protein
LESPLPQASLNLHMREFNAAMLHDFGYGGAPLAFACASSCNIAAR